jgi:protein-S-isoprenylcysteine O-methyltransferase Ste14
LRKVPEFFVAVMLALLFTAALIYLTIEIPRVIHEYLLKVFPDYWWWPPPENIESLRPFGYVSFVATLILMFAGFVAKRGRLTALGSIALYLPTFGYFAYTMFFLAGIGILRVLWTPLFDLSPCVLRLGDVVYLPYLLLTLPLAPIFWITGVPGIDASIPLSFVIMALGLVVFILGASTWLYGRFKGFQIIDFWIYKRSRHPQYLGFLLWSYGLLLLVTFVSAPMGGYVPPPSLPWLILILTMVGVALNEENMMVKKHGQKYIRYRDNTPFMLPLPKLLATLITAPARLLLKKNWPENGKEVVYVIVVYGIMLILSSLPSIFLFNF